jgi:hypothetical protein
VRVRYTKDAKTAVSFLSRFCEAGEKPGAKVELLKRSFFSAVRAGASKWVKWMKGTRREPVTRRGAARTWALARRCGATCCGSGIGEALGATRRAIPGPAVGVL